MLALPSDEPLSGLCRVCAADGEPLTDIFDHHQRLRNKIQVCLRIIVSIRARIKCHCCFATSHPFTKKAKSRLRNITE
jgi:hypothetical protein